MANIKDVAKEAGVSVTTVSRVMNDRGYISEKTRKKVYDAMEKIGYHPNELAKNFFRQKTNIIGLILPDISISFYAEETKYIEEHLYKNGYKLMLCNAYNSKEREKEYINMLQRNKVDGIIGITYSDIDKYVSSNLPFVSIDRHFSENVYYVTSENFHGGQLACRELVKRDCQNLAYISGVNKHLNETTERGRGFKAEAKQKNTNLYCLEMPEPLNQAEEQIRTFFEKHPQIDGIFTVNDFMALRVIKVLGEMGKTPVEDYQIIGFDGL